MGNSQNDDKSQRAQPGPKRDAARDAGTYINAHSSSATAAGQGGSGPFSPTAAGYSYQNYPGNFSDTYFNGSNIQSTAKNIISKTGARNNLKWGKYQKWATGPTGPATKQGGWGNSKNQRFLFQNWESAVRHAQQDLAKIPVVSSLPGPDPDNPQTLAVNLLNHLDEAVRFAIYDKTMPGNDTSGIAITVNVGFHSKPNRRHDVKTYWHYPADLGGGPVDRLTIEMTCPFGGWLGYATIDAPATVGKINRFHSRFQVPKANFDQDQNQLLFIFNGLESLPGNGATPGILQPVLQWTKATGWRVRSWYVPVTYTPDISQFPGPDCEKLPGQPMSAACPPLSRPDLPETAANPYWTKAEAVAEDDWLDSFIEWDGSAYKCWFRHTPNRPGSPSVDRAMLRVPGLPAMTHAAAVIEGYKTNPDAAARDYITKQGLPSPVQMTQVELTYDNPPSPLPAWDIGYDDPVPASPGTPIVEYGVNRLRSYKVVAPASGNLNFIAKNPDT